MTNMQVVYIGSIGTRINLTVYRADGTLESSMGLATNLKIHLLGPSGTPAEKTGTLTTDGSDAVFGYTLQADDITQAGLWEVQGQFTLYGWTGWTDPPIKFLAKNPISV